MSGPPLSHLRVVDLADLRGALAGRLLADLGADVIKVEPPGGDPGRLQPPFAGGVAAPDRSLPFLYRNANKRGAIIDLNDAEGWARFAELCDRADILLENFGPEAQQRHRLTPAEVRARHPHLIHVAIADFGLAGPRAGWRAEPLPAFASSGALHASGFLNRPPCWLPGYIAHDCASVFGALGAMAAVLDRTRHAEGQTIEVSVQEAALNGLNPWSIPLADYARLYPLVVPPSPPRNADGAYLVLPTADGFVRVLPATIRQWKAFLTLTGNIEALSGQEWELPVYRLLNLDVIRLLAGDVLRQRSRAAVFAEGVRLGLPISPVNAPDQFVAEEQTRGRGCFRRSGFPHLGDAPFASPPFNFSGTPAVLQRPAPAPKEDDRAGFSPRTEAAPRTVGSAGPLPARTPDPSSGALRRVEASACGPKPSAEDSGGRVGSLGAAPKVDPTQRQRVSDSTQPSGAGERPLLAGMLVIDLGVGAVGPELGWVLGELGAEVVKIESRENLDFLRAVTVEPDAPNRAWTFNTEARGQKSVCLNLRTPRGRELALQLCARAEVVIENNRGGVVRQLGLDYEDVRRVRPDIIYIASQGFGRGGPLGEAPSFGPLNSSFAGSNWLWNHPDTPYPAGCALNHPDHVASKIGAFAVLSALEHRRRTGEGQFIEMAQTEAAAYLLGEFYLQGPCTGQPPQRRGNTSEFAVPHNVYPCAGEDRWCAIAVVDDAGWKRFIGCLGWPDEQRFATAAGRIAARDEIDARVAEWTGTRTPEEAATALQAVGVSAMPVQNPDDHRADAHLATRGAIVTVQHAEIGPERHIGNPLRMSRTPLVTAGAAPLLGADTQDVLTRVLGLEASEVERLISERICY